ncbi:MAG: DNA repair exonuclease [Gammaproteobacteria bacterium]|nr:DNA repair exonuclease [Gammaproteobacteria bacterium]
MKFIHAADLHLDSPLRGLDRYDGAPAEMIRSASRRAFENLIRLAIDEKVSFILIAGDLFDGDWQDYNTGLYLVRCLGQLLEAQIEIFIISGNHDAQSHMSRSLPYPENVRQFSTDTPESYHLPELNLYIHGQGFAKREVTEDLSQHYPDAVANAFNIGLLHTSLDGKPGHEPYAPCTLEGLCSKGYDYWALGHIHRQEVVRQSPWVVYPGNLQGRHIRETGGKGCTLVTVDAGEVVEVKPIALDVMRWSHEMLLLEDSHHYEQIPLLAQEVMIQAQQGAEGREIALRLEIAGKISWHDQLLSQQDTLLHQLRAVANALVGTGVWLEKVVIQTQPLQEESAVSSDTLSQLLQAVERYQNDPQQLTPLLDDVTKLREKLPIALRQGEEPYDPLSEIALKQTLAAVKSLLSSKLQGKERT